MIGLSNAGIARSYHAKLGSDLESVFNAFVFGPYDHVIRFAIALMITSCTFIACSTAACPYRFFSTLPPWFQSLASADLPLSKADTSRANSCGHLMC